MNMSMSKRSGILGRILFGILGAACLFGSQAKANFIASLQEVGTDVIMTGSGTIDLTALSFLRNEGENSLVDPQDAFFTVSSGLAQLYRGTFVGPTSFGSGGFTFAPGTGDVVGINIASDVVPYVIVPQGYTSGNPLSGTSTYSGQTLASLGVTAGIYTWTWGTGANADSLSLYAGVPVPGAAVPETGSTLTLLLIPAGLMFLAKCRSRKTHLCPIEDHHRENGKFPVSVGSKVVFARKGTIDLPR